MKSLGAIRHILEFDMESRKGFPRLRQPARRTAILFGTGRAVYKTVASARKKILVVEPSGDWRDLLTFIIPECGYEVINARVGKNVIDQAMAIHPDLILLDVGVAGIGGDGILAQLQMNSFTRGIPVIAETAQGEPESARQAIAAGAKQVLYKPFDLGDLPRILRQNLASVEN